MTPDLMYVAWTAILLVLLWIPYIVGSVSTKGMLTPAEYKTPLEREEPEWLRRCNRAHVNLVENFAPFAALVIVAHLTDQATAATASAAAIFFWARLVHAVAYILGIPFLRTVLFSVGVFATLFIGWEVIT
jgi:uncharacterized MAPEG superfamily protein